MADRTLDPAVSFYRLESTSIHKTFNRGPIDGIRTSHSVACVQRDRSHAVNTNTAYLYKRCIHNTSSEPAVGYKFQQILHLLLWNDFLISPCQQKRDTKQHPSQWGKLPITEDLLLHPTVAAAHLIFHLPFSFFVNSQ